MRRKVALKIIKPGMDTQQVIARFEAERQALAMMDHPNIAKVLDGGTTESGRPYFVMELVRGMPITEYCDREQLSIRERLELFVLVCRAVQHAHQKGIIHRDLKPSNILVTLHDGVPVPKVIDFGVAKATGQSLTDKTLYTAFAQLVGTPLYMSPEQVELSGLDIDTRSDIYSLGVLLYELLTGTTPFDAETLQAGGLRRDAADHPRGGAAEAEHAAEHARRDRSRPSRPSARPTRRRLGRSMRGELDWIVMKALEKDRRRRYETANDFAADVMRYLTDQPVRGVPAVGVVSVHEVRPAEPGGPDDRGLWSRLALVAARPSASGRPCAPRRADARGRRPGRTSRSSRRLPGQRRLRCRGAGQEAQGRSVTVDELLDAPSDQASPIASGRSRWSRRGVGRPSGEVYYASGDYDGPTQQFRRVAELRSEHLGPEHPATLAAAGLHGSALCRGWWRLGRPNRGRGADRAPRARRPPPRARPGSSPTPWPR